ncbi:hypothetical protein BgiBS90_001850 [Biomphalaria glabrata]|uniref:Uncharacterized protein n=1 Tax=Biomphalaria glabrata TaxID=6526 RepID=A0A2C9M417_BIOGL|nr:hypothetical protein BgiBS90_001850 [Biomphalaria glabrata]
MKAFFLLATFAVVCVTYIQCQDCSPVNACIGNDFREKIKRKSQVADFPAVCIDYKNALDCINAASVAGCQVAGSAAITTLTNLTHKTCGPDGKLTGCGYDVYQCVLQAQNILLDYKNNNVTAACPVVTKFSTCANAIKANTECDAGLVASLIDAETMFKQDALLTGCYGPCAAAIGNCTLGLATDISGLYITQTNWTNFCIDAYKALSCMKQLNAGSVCAGTSEAQVLQAQLASQDAYLKDYCDASGRPSQCVVGLSMCNADIVNLSPQSDIKTQCAAAANFLECTSSLPCEQELASVVQDMRNQFQTGERSTNCPTVGSCNTRLVNCQSADVQLKTVTATTSKQQFCKIVTSAIRCFDFVRNDPICERENMMVSEFETSMAVDAAPTCGAVIGTCMDRIKVCDDFEHIINNINATTDPVAFCNRTRQGINCFDTVRTDNNCTQDKVQVTKWETTIRNLIAPMCKGGATMVHVPLILLVACLLVSMDKIVTPLWKRITQI